MKKLIIIIICSFFIYGCLSSVHTESEIIGKTPDGLVEFKDRKSSSGFSLFPTTEKAESMSRAYTNATKANNHYSPKSRLEQPQTGSIGSGFLPEEGNVLFSTKGASSIGSTRPYLINNADGYSVKVLSGPFATDFPLMPNEGIDAIADIKPGEITITYEWKNLKTGQVGQKTIPRTIVPGQAEVYVSDTLARKNGLI
jgi:hypothetical protein